MQLVLLLVLLAFKITTLYGSHAWNHDHIISGASNIINSHNVVQASWEDENRKAAQMMMRQDERSNQIRF